MFFFDTASVHIAYVVNEGADDKLNSMDSVGGHRNVVIMRWALQPIAMAYLKPCQHDLFLNVLGNQTTKAVTLTNFDQPVLAYKRFWCRDIL